MAVDSEHQDYASNAHRWSRVRDVLAGEDKVKEAGSEYLPRLSGQDDNGYAAYKSRALFHEATGRTLEGLVGAIFRKEPAIDPQDDELLDDVTGTGIPFADFAQRVTSEVIATGRYGVLVDVPGQGKSYMTGYIAENILNWRTTLIDGRPKLSLVVLREWQERPRVGDPFETDKIEQFRVLWLGTMDAPGEGPLVYFQQLFERVQGGTAVKNRGDIQAVTEPFTPTRTGQRLDFIPFQFFGPQDLTPRVQAPPLLGLANVNLSHYRTSADLEHGAHFTAMPTPWVAGGSQQDQLRIGGDTVWYLDPDGSAGILEYTGKGLDALEKRLERKEAHMAVLGARLLEDQKAGVEASETVAMRHRGENSLLAKISHTISRGLGNTLFWMAWWNGSGDNAANITVALNTDFIDRRMAPREIVDLVAAWQQGGIGGRALHHNLLEGERLPDGMTFDEWIEDIEQFGPGGVIGGEPLFGRGGENDESSDESDDGA